MTRIYLLRHGETAWNAAGNRYCGRTDLPLSATGWNQAERAARALAELPLAAVYVSPLRRSRQTGEAIGAGHGLPTLPDPRLIEIDFGIWEGLTGQEIADADPAGRAAWLRNPEVTHAGQTGETGREVSDRMAAALLEIAAAHPATSLAVIGHNTANRLFLAASLDAPLARYRHLVLDNASISTLEIAEGEVRWLHINDVAHLKR